MSNRIPKPQLTSDGHIANRCRCRILVPGPIVRGNHVENRLMPGGKPVLFVTFRNGEVVEVVYVHWNGRDNCPKEAEYVDPREWVRSCPTTSSY